MKNIAIVSLALALAGCAEVANGIKAGAHADLEAVRQTGAAIRTGDFSRLSAGPGADGQTVYSAGECIGAVVNGQCHGSILPQTATHPVCHGEMIGGQCTGPMF